MIPASTSNDQRSLFENVINDLTALKVQVRARYRLVHLRMHDCVLIFTGTFFAFLKSSAYEQPSNDCEKPAETRTSEKIASGISTGAVNVLRYQISSSAYS